MFVDPDVCGHPPSGAQVVDVRRDKPEPFHLKL